MPIKPENRWRYPANWPEIRAKILERAEYRCECEGECKQHSDYCFRLHGALIEPDRPSRVVLTIAHLDHTPEHCDDSNLKAMCQRCHLAYDADHHAQTRYETNRAGKAVGDLFGG